MRNPIDRYMKVDKLGEYWSAREMQKVFGFSSWSELADKSREIVKMIRRHGQNPRDYFAESVYRVSGEDRVMKDYRLSRLAVYYLALQADIHNEMVSRVLHYMARTVRDAEEQKSIEIYNRELFEAESGSFSVAEWARGYIQEKRLKNVYPVAKKLQFKTLVYGLTRKTGSKEYTLNNVAYLDRLSGNVYGGRAKKIASALLRDFNYVRNSIAEEKVKEQ